jgi:hypothetical protein
MISLLNSTLHLSAREITQAIYNALISSTEKVLHLASEQEVNLCCYCFEQLNSLDSEVVQVCAHENMKHLRWLQFSLSRLHGYMFNSSGIQKYDLCLNAKRHRLRIQHTALGSALCPMYTVKCSKRVGSAQWETEVQMCAAVSTSQHNMHDIT